MDCLLISVVCLAFVRIAQAEWTPESALPTQYIGCFKDVTSDPAMGNGIIIRRLTLGRCRAHCHNASSTFFAAQGGVWCHCGEQFDKHGTIPSYAHELFNCAMQCTGNDAQMCGGVFTLSVYRVCPAGYYGRHCANVCGQHCLNDPKLLSGCRFDGTCLAGCRLGRTGPSCDISLQSSPSLYLRPHGDRVFLLPDSSYVWTCQVSGAADNVEYDIRWYSPNGTEITDTAGSLMVEAESQSTKKLYVLRITDQVAGNYSCRANISGHLQQKIVELVIYEDISMDSSPSPLTVTFNNDVLIRCTSSGRPKPTISWKFGDQPVTSGGRYELVQGEGLTIRDVSATDSGSYTCRAEVHSDGRYDERVVTLEVHSPPKITRFNIGDSVQHDGMSAIFSCEAIGRPRPLFRFYKEGNTAPLRTTSRITVSDLIGMMIFTPVHKSDEGSYSCRVSNSFGNDTRTGRLRVFPESLFPLQSASIPTQRPPAEHVNVCLVNNGGCEQVCIDTVYSYRCECRTGKLQGDHRTCEVNSSTTMIITLSCVASAVFLTVLIGFCMKCGKSNQRKRSSTWTAAGADTSRGFDEMASLAGHHRDQPVSLDNYEVPADDHPPALNPYYSSDQVEAATGCVTPSAPSPDHAPPSYADLYGTDDCTAAAGSGDCDGGTCGGDAD